MMEDIMKTDGADFVKEKSISKPKKHKSRRKINPALAKSLREKKYKLLLEEKKNQKIINELQNRESTCVRFRPRSSFQQPNSKSSIFKTNEKIGRSVLKPNPFSQNYKECTYNHNHGAPMGLWYEEAQLCKRVTKADQPYFTNCPAHDLIKKCKRRKHVQCAFKKFKMPGCDCKTCWEYRMKSGPKPCLPKPICELKHVDSSDNLSEMPLEPRESLPITPTDRITTFFKTISSRVLASVLGRSSGPEIGAADDLLQPWQRYAAATAMSEAPRPALFEELKQYSPFDIAYSNPVAQLEREQYEQKDITTRDEPRTLEEVGGKRNKGKKIFKGKKAVNGKGKKGKNIPIATNEYGQTPFKNDRVAQLPRDHATNKSISQRIREALRDDPSQYESELIATEAANNELVRREAVANGEIDPSSSECSIM